MNRISVIIPAFNSECYISSAIESVFAQTCKDLDVVVIDDGSTDNTHVLVKELRHPITFVTQQNAGPSIARNKGVQLTKGEYVAFLDADDIWLPQKLALQAEILDNHSNVGMVTCGRIHIDSQGHQIGVYIPPVNRYKGQQLINRLAVSNIIGGASAVLVRRSVLNRVGLFDPTLTVSEDTDLWIRIAGQCEIESIDTPLFQYRILSNSQSSAARINIQNQLILTNRLLNLGIISKKVRRHALSYKYYCAAWSFLQSGERRLAISHCFRALRVDPVYYLENKAMLALLVRVIIGDRIYNLMLKAFQGRGHEKAI